MSYDLEKYIKENIKSIKEDDIQKYYQMELENKFQGKDGKNYLFIYSKSSRTDSILEIDENCKIEALRWLKIIMECKSKSIFSDTILLGCISQILFYLKIMKTEFQNHELPKYPDLCFYCGPDGHGIQETKDIIKYINHEDLNNIDNGSSAFKSNECLNLKKQLIDDKILSKVKKYNGIDCIKQEYIIQEIINLYNKNEFIPIEIDIDTSSVCLSELKNNILRQKLTSEQLAALFISIKTNPDRNKQKDTDENILLTEFKEFPEVKIVGNEYTTFCKKYRIEKQRKDELISNQDELIDSPDRIGKAQFYTNSIISKDSDDDTSKFLYENKIIPEKNFRKCALTVKDSSCGNNAQLTRHWNDYQNLFLSTLLQSDIDTIIQNNYNPNSYKYKMDFLDDLGEDCFLDDINNLPDGEKIYLDLLKNNPDSLHVERENIPFRGADQNKANKGSKNKISDIMAGVEYGINKTCCNNISSGFIFRWILRKRKYKLNNFVLAFFHKSTLFQSNQWEKLRDLLCNNFKYIGGNLYESKEFGTKENRPICYSVWHSGGKTSHRNFTLNIKTVVGNKCIKKNNIILFPIEDKKLSASEWAKLPKIKAKKEIPIIEKYNKPTNKFKKVDVDSFGYLQNHSNNIGSSRKLSAFWTAIPKDQYIEIKKENIHRACALYTIRKLSIKEYPNWYQETIEFLRPTNCHTQSFKIWMDNCIVFSLFYYDSRQASFRINKNILTNDFFWIPRAIMKNYIDECKFKILINDFYSFKGERILANIIQNLDLYKESEDLVKFTTLKTLNSVKDRSVMYLENPKKFDKYQLACWDAGWIQIRKSFLTQQEIKKYKFLINKLSKKLKSGIKKYRFII